MRYKRILLKLSGESLQGDGSDPINRQVLQNYCKEVSEAVKKGHQIAIVIGGGNIFRGLSGTNEGYDRVKGDQMGMLATVINSIAIESELTRTGVEAKVFTAIRMEPVGELYVRDKVAKALGNGVVTILAGGTGNPFFTTDTASALRAVELNCDALAKGTRVDGIYSADPEKDPSAKRFTKMTFREALEKRVKIMDLTAFTMCEENNMPVVVFDMNREGNLGRLLRGEEVGTLVNVS